MGRPEAGVIRLSLLSWTIGGEFVVRVLSEFPNTHYEWRDDPDTGCFGFINGTQKALRESRDWLLARYPAGKEVSDKEKLEED